MLETLPGHQNVMRYLFHDTIDNALRIFTTRYDCTLQHILKQRKSSACPFLVSEIMQFGLEVVRGLIFLHENNIIHKDIRVSTLFERKLKSTEINFLFVERKCLGIQARVGVRIRIGEAGYRKFRSQGRTSGRRCHHSLRSSRYSLSLIVVLTIFFFFFFLQR